MILFNEKKKKEKKIIPLQKREEKKEKITITNQRESRDGLEVVSSDICAYVYAYINKNRIFINSLDSSNDHKAFIRREKEYFPKN